MTNKTALLAALLLAGCTAQPQPQPQTHSAPAPQTAAADDLMALIQPQNVVSAEPEQRSEPPFFNQDAPSVAQTGFAANPNVEAFIRHHAAHSGLDEAGLRQFFAGVSHRANILSIMDRPGTSNPWYKFKTGNSGAAKIAGGKRFYQANRAVIDRAAAQYGVPAEIITAIVGIETNYGANTGNIRTADALATLAFDYPRRSRFFQQELAELLKLAQEENRDPFEFYGSFAGAMGMPQFMPSSLRKWAVDFDGNGKRDIWRSIPDIAASVAHYMQVHGWQTGGKVIVPVALDITPQLQAVIDEKTALKYSVGELKQMGVLPLQAVADDEKAVLFRLETAPGQYEYFIGLNNFYTIWQYNHSRMYVTAVRDIANSIGAGGL